MKVLVTGANGQLGYDVIKRLNALGDEEITTSTSARIAIRMIVCTVLGC